MKNPLLESNAKLIINRNRIINSIKNKLDYHRSMADLYSQKAVDPESYDEDRGKFRINAWRHNREVDRLTARLVTNEKILAKLQQM